MVLQVPAHAAGDKPNKDTFDYTLTPLNGYAITGGVTDYVESLTGTGDYLIGTVCLPSITCSFPTTAPIMPRNVANVDGRSSGSASFASFDDIWYVGGNAIASNLTAFRRWLGCYGAAWLAQDAKERRR